MATAAPQAVVAVAVSGGRDSVALLHCCARMARQALAAPGLQVVALHVHHGLMPEADHWLSNLQQQVRRWARSGMPVSLEHTRLTEAPAKGDSVEAWARQQRYRALAAMAQGRGATAVLLAQHRDDQVETVLLQALRGAGPAGLSAMPTAFERHGMQFYRPWLHYPGAAIEHYIERFGLAYVDDASNADPRFARGRLRSQVLPAWRMAFPEVDRALCAVAERAQEAAACLDALAQSDLATCLAAPGGLVVQAWQGLAPARRRNALRHWLKTVCPQAASESLVKRLDAELPGRRVGQWPSPCGPLRCHAGVLKAPLAIIPPCVETSLSSELDLSRPGRYALPAWHGAMHVRAVAQAGIAAEDLAQVFLNSRTEGMNFQQGPRSMPRALKKQFQAAAVPAWQRAGPVVRSQGGTLLFVAGLGMDARAVQWQAKAGLRALSWLPDESV